MTKKVWEFVVVAFLSFISLGASTAFSQESTAPLMSVCQARTSIVTALQNLEMSHFAHGSVQKHVPTDIKVHTDSIEFFAEVDYDKKAGPRMHIVKLDGLKPIKVEMWGDIYKQKWAGGAHYYVTLYEGQQALKLVWDSDRSNYAERFANAFNRLLPYAQNYNPANSHFPPPCEEQAQGAFWNDFHQKAAAWGALSTKPPMSDDVRQHRLLAEDAMKEKHMDTAIAEYEGGLAIDPLWPQGHFNAALLYGEQKDYEDAVWHMRAYLELAPDAPDAQAARDQLLLWQGKLKQQGAPN